MEPAKSHEKLQQSLSLVLALLDRHRVLETMTHMQEGPKRDLLESLVHRQNLAELRQKLKDLHPADLAHVLESLPPPDRLLVWNQVEPEQASQVLLEASRAVRESLLEDMDRSRLLDLLRRMDADDLGYVADSVDPDVLQEVYRTLDAGDQNWVRSSMAYPEDAVGNLMSPDVIAVREDWPLEEVLRDLRRRHELPPQTDALFVVDSRNVLRGALPLKTLLVEEPGARAVEVMALEPVAFTPDDHAAMVANAFQRYDLVSAPVVDERGKPCSSDSHGSS